MPPLVPDWGWPSGYGETSVWLVGDGSRHPNHETIRALRGIPLDNWQTLAPSPGHLTIVRLRRHLRESVANSYLGRGGFLVEVSIAGTKLERQVTRI